MSIGLLRIEARRTVGLWLTPVMVVLVWVIYQQRSVGPNPLGALWSDGSMAVRDTAQPLWSVIGGAAAWMAGRQSRRGMSDLLATTPCPDWWRELSTWTGTVAWGVLVYLVLSAVILVKTWTQATWGGPSLGPITVGLLALIASGALGYTIGYYFPNRFTPPLVAIGLFMAVELDYYLHQWYSFLAPQAHGQITAWGIVPDVSGPQSLFLLGLIGVALGGLGLAGGWTFARWSVGLAGLLLAVAGAVLVQRSVPQDSFGQPMALSEFPLTRITPACTRGPVTVCVHPAFRARLLGITGMINRIAAPLVGIPGAPTRFIDDDIVAGMSGPVLGNPSSPSQVAQLRRDGIFVFRAPPAGTAVFAPEDGPNFIALALVFRSPNKGAPTEAQETLMIWLLRRAGFSSDLYSLNMCAFPGVSYPNAAAAANRFGGLPAAQQRAWLRAHFASLRSGFVRTSASPPCKVLRAWGPA